MEALLEDLMVVVPVHMVIRLEVMVVAVPLPTGNPLAVIQEDMVLTLLSAVVMVVVVTVRQHNRVVDIKIEEVIVRKLLMGMEDLTHLVEVLEAVMILHIHHCRNKEGIGDDRVLLTNFRKTILTT